MHAVRCNAQPGLDRDTNLRRNLPMAPPTRVPPPPPPPPSQVAKNDLNISRRGLAAIMLGGSAVYYFALNGVLGRPPVERVDRQRNVALLRTAKGNVVAATTDAQGRMFMFDRKGNIYYDTEDPRLGLYIVDTQGNMYNQFVDGEGKVQTVPVGSIYDLQTVEASWRCRARLRGRCCVRVEKLGGVDAKDLPRSFRDAQKKFRITGFLQEADPNDPTSYLPPPWGPATDKDGKVGVMAPPFLEDKVVELEKRPFAFGAEFPETDKEKEELMGKLKRDTGLPDWTGLND
ncbi:hypothetical protein N2152v2_011194 [Parachlorella kessleri]